jgi:hypothetical protein
VGIEAGGLERGQELAEIGGLPRAEEAHEKDERCHKIGKIIW